MAIPKVPTIKDLKRAGINILVYIPMAKEGVPSDAFIHLWDIAKRGYPHPPFLGGRTDANRNKVAHWMLRPENKRYTHVLMLDADHLHPEDIVERHARWVLEDRSRLVVGSLNFRRTPPHDACLFQPDEEGHLHSMEKWPRGLIQTPLMGHGSILIDRKVFETLEPPWWRYMYDFAEHGSYPAEDTFFCLNCVKHEIALWCDTTITSPHLYTATVTEETFSQYRAWKARQANEG